MRKFLALAVLLCLGAAPSARGGDLTESARVLIDYQSSIRGDPDNSARFYLSRAGDFSGTPLAELSLRMALAQDPAYFSAVDIGESEARRILAQDKSLSPEIRDLARRYIARSMLYSGRRDEAMAIHRQRGVAMDWDVAGPFRMLEVFQPENAYEVFGEAVKEEGDDVLADLPDGERFDEWRRHPPWRHIPAGQSLPFIQPWLWIDAAGGGAALLKTGLAMESSDNRGEFRIFCDAAWSLYIDGALVASVNRYKYDSLREQIVDFPLAAGEHSIAVLLPPPPAGTAKNSRFSMRLQSTSPFEWKRGIPLAPKASGAARRDARQPRYLEELAGMAGQSPSLRSAYALAAAEQGMIDIGSWNAAEAAAADRDNLNLMVLSGILFANDSMLPVDRRRDIAASWFSRSLEARPDLIPSLLYMAEIASAAGKAEEAGEYLTRAYAVNPSSLEVLLARGEWARRFSTAVAAREAWEQVDAAYPNSLAAQRAISSMDPERYMDMEVRIAACRRAVAAGDRFPDSLMRLAEALADSGNAEATASTVRETLAAFPDDCGVLAWAGGVYARLRQYDDAVAAFGRAVNLTPWQADLWRRLGDVCREQGKKELALDYWRVSLAADPGQYDLREMVNLLSGGSEDLQYDGGYDAVAMAANIELNQYPGDVVRLLDRSVVFMERDGSYMTLTHEIDLVQTRAGGESLANVPVQGELLTARTIFPNGESLEPENIPGRSGLRLPALMPGTLREMQYLQFYPAVNGTPQRQRPWYFQHPNDNRPFLISEYEVHAPSGMPIVRVLRDQGIDIDFEYSQDKSHDVYRWTARLGMAGYEPDAVNVSERLASVTTGKPTTWEEVTYSELAGLSGRLRPSLGMMRLLDSLFTREDGSRLSPEESARAVYRFVCDNIHPLAVEGQDSRQASHILANRAGDRSLLLLAMLRAAGFDAYPAAARPSQDFFHPPAWELPRRDIFPVPLVRLSLPGSPPLLLDTRFETLPFAQVADDLSDAAVIAFLPSGPIFDGLPRLPLNESERYEQRRILLPAPGKPVGVVGRSSLKGVAGLARREFMTASGQADRRRQMLQSLFPVFPDAKLTRFDVLRPLEDESFSLERYEMESSTAVEKRPDGVMATPLCLAPLDLVSRESRDMQTRTTVCHIRKNNVARDRNTFVLPEGAHFVRLPKPANIPGNFGVYQLRVVHTGDRQVDIERRFRCPAQRIKTWEWKDFLRFLDDIDLAEKQWIEYAFDE